MSKVYRVKNKGDYTWLCHVPGGCKGNWENPPQLEMYHL